MSCMLSCCRSLRTICQTSSVTVARSSLVHADIAEASGQWACPRTLIAGYNACRLLRVLQRVHSRAGDVIISEIMWGLDGNDTATSQYIELHNTTAADIGIDNNEWVIAVGRVPTRTTQLSLIRSATIRLPATGQVPGTRWCNRS